MSGRILVAGVGNVFLGDDGFGVEVARRLRLRALPEQVKVEDFGIRGLHLAFELLEPIALAVIADAAVRGEAPGTISLIEPELGASIATADAHGMDLGKVMETVRAMGGSPPRMLLVGCEPMTLEEQMGLSAPVERAIDPAIDLVLEVLRRELGEEMDS